MTTTDQNPASAITPTQPDSSASAQDWVAWFWADFLPGWIDHAHAPGDIGFYDLLDANGQPAQTDRRTILAQARLLFTFSHLALLSDHPAYHKAARIARDALPAFRKSSGLYARARTAKGAPTGDPKDELATSYDQTFIILGLSTWGRLHPEEDVTEELEACWAGFVDQLTDPVTGLLLEHDGLADPAAPDAPNRAQNPHMHLYEAALQACEMTNDPVWLDRAATMRAKGVEYFFDDQSGTITEFLAPDLSILPGRDGQRREVGHQCEWAWLLLREAELGGDPKTRDIAGRLLAFADQHGFAVDGIVRDLAFDAVAADASWREDRFLLWPQTEAIKTYAVRAADEVCAVQAQALALQIFHRYFAGRRAYANQLTVDGQALWPDALSRLHYHLVLALTEGARAGLWAYPKAG